LETVPDCDYWKNTSLSDWRSHVIESVGVSRHLIKDSNGTFLDSTKVLSDVYLSLHGKRAATPQDPCGEREMEDLFWHMQRSSAVIDCIVGAACVALMRWIEEVKWIAIDAFVLMETKFPFEADTESEKVSLNRYKESIMRDFGSSLPDKQVRGALAVWQIGNVFKHAGGKELRPELVKVARTLGFSSSVLRIPEHDSEEDLRQSALKEVGYTLDADSIERMSLQLGCGPVSGLIPLYDHVESWRKAIDQKLSDEQAVLRSLL